MDDQGSWDCHRFLKIHGLPSQTNTERKRKHFAPKLSPHHHTITLPAQTTPAPSSSTFTKTKKEKKKLNKMPHTNSKDRKKRTSSDSNSSKKKIRPKSASASFPSKSGRAAAIYDDAARQLSKAMSFRCVGCPPSPLHTHTFWEDMYLHQTVSIWLDSRLVRKLQNWPLKNEHSREQERRSLNFGDSWRLRDWLRWKKTSNSRQSGTVVRLTKPIYDIIDFHQFWGDA